MHPADSISLLASLRLSLDSMGFVQLLLAFVSLFAYAVALGAPSMTPARIAATAVAVLSAIGFAAATPAWTAGVVLVAIGIAGVGVFAAVTWLLSVLFGVATTRGRLAADTPFITDSSNARPGHWQRGRAFVATVLDGGPVTVRRGLSLSKVIATRMS